MAPRWAGPSQLTEPGELSSEGGAGSAASWTARSPGGWNGALQIGSRDIPSKMSHSKQILQADDASFKVRWRSAQVDKANVVRHTS